MSITLIRSGVPYFESPVRTSKITLLGNVCDGWVQECYLAKENLPCQVLSDPCKLGKVNCKQ